MFCSICPKFINNEPCQDHIEYCEFELAEHDDKIRANERNKLIKTITEYVEKGSSSNCFEIDTDIFVKWLETQV